MAKLTFRYRYDGTPKLILDDFGRLDLQVVTEDRSGRGGFWVQWQDVKEFCGTLGTYPIDATQPLSAEWGYTEDEVYHQVLSITIAPVDALGHLRVRVTIADEHDPIDCVKTSFQATYADLTSLQVQLVALMAGDSEEATLRGS
ncbi:hypothetical protein [Sphingomonas xinjiangensis]|uniref:Uncharacterized protein n=1 Tax=Sphingomonas xinjiangensis TaxID=643568 RepID=A0A840YTQ4_9SPHN|nr:hypothetical protein [Sphingomonas xinjiangensis]MBB5713106.1 hypothetical protein [Sphingomonas xinjiangensis]